MAEGFDIDHLAKLARLDLTAAEKALYSTQLNSILGHFRALAEADLPASIDDARVVREAALRDTNRKVARRRLRSEMDARGVNECIKLGLAREALFLSSPLAERLGAALGRGGSVKWKVEPTPSWLSTLTAPSCASTKVLTMARPRPE